MATIGRYRGKTEYLLVYNELITAARYSGTVTYQEIADIMGLPLTGHRMGREVGQILREISQDENAAGRPLLSAIAVRSKGYLGDGFFDLARELQREVGHSKEDELRFWEAEKAAVYEAWKRELRAR